MPLTLVLARADNGVIGMDGALPWHIPADLKRFRALTMGRAIIMGRKTFESLPRLLPGRHHIVLTRDPAWRAEHVDVAHDPATAMMLGGDDAMVIGGADIFTLFLPLADRIELTEVHAAPEGEVVVPRFVGWHETAREDHMAAGDGPAYAFVTLARGKGLG